MPRSSVKQALRDFDDDASFWAEIVRGEATDTFEYLMEDANVNYSELARRMEVSRSRISHIFRASQNFTIETLVKVCLAIGYLPKISFVPKDKYFDHEEFVRSAIQLGKRSGKLSSDEWSSFDFDSATSPHRSVAFIGQLREGTTGEFIDEGWLEATVSATPPLRLVPGSADRVVAR